MSSQQESIIKSIDQPLATHITSSQTNDTDYCNTGHFSDQSFVPNEKNMLL